VIDRVDHDDEKVHGGRTKITSRPRPSSNENNYGDSAYSSDLGGYCGPGGLVTTP
jgi:hypothetical protein